MSDRCACADCPNPRFRGVLCLEHYRELDFERPLVIVPCVMPTLDLPRAKVEQITVEFRPEGFGNE